MDAQRLDNAFEFTRRCTQNGRLLVVRHGYLVLERYFGRAARNVNPDMASTGRPTPASPAASLVDRVPGPSSGQPEHTRLHRRLSPGGAAAGRSPTHGHHARATPVHVLRLLGRRWRADRRGGWKMLTLKPVPRTGHSRSRWILLRVPMWTNAGAGYSYSSPAPPSRAWYCGGSADGNWDYIQGTTSPHRWAGDPGGLLPEPRRIRMPHATRCRQRAVHATDALRFGYCLLHQGRWNGKQLVPAAYVALLQLSSRRRSIRIARLRSSLAELRRPRGRSAARWLEIQRRRFRDPDRAVPRPRDLQDGRWQRTIRSDLHRHSQPESIIRGTTEADSPDPRSTRAASEATTDSGACWRWSAIPSWTTGDQRHGIAHPLQCGFHAHLGGRQEVVTDFREARELRRLPMAAGEPLNFRDFRVVSTRPEQSRRRSGRWGRMEQEG